MRITSWAGFICTLCTFISPSMSKVVLPAKILVSYTHGVEQFNDTLITLLNYTEDQDLKQFFSNMFHSINASHESFSQSQTEASLHHRQLSEELTNTRALIDSHKLQLQNKIAEKAAKEAVLRGQQHALQQARHHLSNSEKNLQNLEHSIRHIQKKIKKKKYCLRRRRKRGLFRELKKAFKKIFRPVERAICHVVYGLTGKLRELEKVKSRTQQDLANYRNVVIQASQSVSRTEAIVNSLNHEIHVIHNPRLPRLNKKISSLNAELEKTVSIRQKIRQADQFLSLLVNRMGTSAEAVSTSQAALLIANMPDVVDFENVVQPLIEAGQLISGSSSIFIVPDVLYLNSENRQIIAQNVAALGAKLALLQKKYGNDSNLFDSISLESDLESSSSTPITETSPSWGTYPATGTLSWDTSNTARGTSNFETNPASATSSWYTSNPVSETFKWDTSSPNSILSGTPSWDTSNSARGASNFETNPASATSSWYTSNPVSETSKWDTSSPNSVTGTPSWDTSNPVRGASSSETNPASATSSWYTSNLVSETSKWDTSNPASGMSSWDTYTQSRPSK